MSADYYFDELYKAILLNSIPDLLEVISDVKDSQLSLETVLAVQNAKKQTLLHLASAQLQDEMVRLLLLNGANPNCGDVDGRTPVAELLANLRENCQCEDCTRKAVRCIRYLGQFGAKINECDKMGQTPLQVSALIGQEVSMELLKQGASLNTDRKSKKHVMTTLLENLPDIILPIFDRAIEADFKRKHDPAFELSFDMSVILPSKQNGCGCDGKSPKREMSFLRKVLKASLTRDVQTYRAILQHPIVHVFTDIKWNKLKTMYFLFLGFQVNLLLFFVIFLLLIVYNDCAASSTTSDNDSLNSTNIFFRVRSEIWSSSTTSDRCKISIATKVVAAYVLFCTVISFLKEIYNLVTDFWSYVRDFFSLVNWIGLGTMTATTVIALNPITPPLESWLFPLAAFGVGFCFVQLFLNLGEMPSLAIYVDMFTTITVNFFISLLVYSPIIIAFTMTYTILFPSENNIMDAPRSFLRILTMMIGELNFETIFSPDQWVRNSLLAHVWYGIFLVVVAMILMNLLVGLAVHDIGGCRKDAELVMMRRKIRYLNSLEKTYYLTTLLTAGCLKTYLRKRINVVAPSTKSDRNLTDYEIKKKYSIQVLPNKPASASKFHSVTTAAIRQWIIRQDTTENHLDSYCRRDKNYYSIQNSRHYKEVDLETKELRMESMSATKKEAKKLVKMENSLIRLETRLLDITAKLDNVLKLISNSSS